MGFRGMFLIGLCSLSACREKKPKQLEGHTDYVQTKTMHGCVRYGVAYGELVFVIFEMFPISERVRIKSELNVLIGNVKNGEIVTFPTGRYDRRITTRKRLFEYQNNQYVGRAELVRLDELKAFLSSHPQEYSISALLSFIELRKQ